jgi:hypothetical protein
VVKQDMGLFEHRGVVIVIEKDDENSTTTYIAKAGGRSVITLSWTGTDALKKTIDLAHKKINEAYEGNTEKLALWLNDSTHWYAENKDIEPPVMFTVPALVSILEEVMRAVYPKGMNPAIKEKAEKILARAKKEL